MGLWGHGRVCVVAASSLDMDINWVRGKGAIKVTLAKLDRFDAKEKKKILRKTLREAAKFIVLPTAKSMAPKDSGTLKKSLKVRSVKNGRARRRRKAVGVGVMNVNKSLFTGSQFYLGFLEYGTKPRKTKAGENRGKIERDKHDFMARSLRAQEKAVTMFVMAKLRAAARTL